MIGTKNDHSNTGYPTGVLITRDTNQSIFALLSSSGLWPVLQGKTFFNNTSLWRKIDSAGQRHKIDKTTVINGLCIHYLDF